MTDPHAEAEVSYAHHSAPNGQRFIDLASSKLPKWAVDVQPYTRPTIVSDEALPIIVKVLVDHRGGKWVSNLDTELARAILKALEK